MSSQAYFQEYYQANREKKLERAKAYYAANKDAKQEYDRLRRVELGDQLREYDRQRGDDRRGTVKAMLLRAKARARKDNVPFDLSVNDVTIPDTCPALGITLYSRTGRGGGDNSPSLDRTIPGLGYVRGNVQVISNKANRMKNNGSLEELVLICQWLERQTTRS